MYSARGNIAPGLAVAWLARISHHDDESSLVL